MDLSEDDRNLLVQTIMRLRARGIRDRALLSALERMPRHDFVDPKYYSHAYGDRPLPIGFGETMSQLYLVGIMVAALELDDTDKVFEVGTGSGYQTAIMAKLARRVYTMERRRPLLRAAESRFANLGITNITGLFGDGGEGWAPQAPFTKMIVSCCVDEIPAALLEQLAIGGRLVLPMGSAEENQSLMLIQKNKSGYDQTMIAQVRFAPLRDGKSGEV